MKVFEYFSPQILEEVLEILIKYGKEAVLMAGGTDLIVRMKEGEISPKSLINLKRIPNLNKIEWDGESIRIGALTTIHQIESSPIVQEKLELLSEAASVLGSFQIRNKGTVGGNLCHASPSADLAPPLIALDGKLCMRGKSGERKEALENFFIGTFNQHCPH
jgi:carbon-monoxide dehydrogenase medium subunit